MPSSRRSFVVGAAALCAGCVGSPRRSGTPQGTPDDTPVQTSATRPAESEQSLGESATVGDVKVRLHDAVVQHSYVSLVYPDFADVVAPEGRQFLFLTVDVSGDGAAPSPDSFAVTAGETVATGRNRGESGRPYRDGRLYTAEHGAGWLLFELPAPVESDRVALELDRGTSGAATWTLPDEVTGRLRAPPPEFEVRDFEAPAEVRPDEPIEVSATIANAGEGAGTFRASLNQEGDALYGAAPLSFDLEAGAERAWTETVTTHQRGELDSALAVRLRFRSAGGNFDRNVVVRPPETTSS